MQKLSKTNEPIGKRVHRNSAQLKYFLVKPHEGWLYLGRGSGKSSGPAADFTSHNMLQLPRANTGLYCNTYTELRSKVLPAVIEGWNHFGLEENKHFFVGQLADDKYNFHKAYRYPRDATHYIHFFNGHGIFLVSGDRSTSNGYDLQAACVDEARKQKKDKLDEFLLTIRGKADVFGHLSSYQSKLFLTDMPKTAKERWVLDAKEQQTEEKKINMIIQLQGEVYRLMGVKAKASVSYAKKITSKINKMELMLNELRKDSVYCQTSSSFVNIHALGMQYFRDMKRNLTDFDWDTSVMSKEVLGIDNGFYPALDEHHHGYNDENYSFIDHILIDKRGSVKRDCRWDNDVNKDKPLDIGCDHNAAINCIVTGQDHADAYRFLSAMHVLADDYLDELIDKWCEYYKYHRAKHVNYYYDHTSTKTNSQGTLPEYLRVIQKLKEHGWTVKAHPQGQASSHHSRYMLYSIILKEKDPKTKKFRFNKTNCSQWLISCSDAPVKQKGDRYVKNKYSEDKKSGVSPEDATHFSEAGDVLFYAKFKQFMGQSVNHYHDLIM